MSQRSFVDEIAVELVVTGQRSIKLNQYEKREVVREMSRRAYRAKDVSARLGCSRRSAERLLRDHGIPADPMWLALRSMRTDA